MEWLPAKMNEYNELMTTYTALKEKECSITGQSSNKKERKEMLLTQKENNTITKEGQIELENINKGEDLETKYRRNIRHVELRKDNELMEIESEYENAEAKAKAIYDSSLLIAKAKKDKKLKASESACERAVEHYTNEKDTSLAKIHREYVANKNTIERQKQRIEGERNLSSKTATEIALEQDKLKILRKMQTLIKTVEISRLNQVADEYRHKTPFPPVLPEPIVSQYVPTAPPVTSNVLTPDIESDTLKDYYEDEATLLQAREEIKQKKIELARKEREAKIAESHMSVSNQSLQRQYVEKYGRTSMYVEGHRPPTVYGPIHVLEKREFKQPAYVPEPVTDEIENDFFTKD
jgi:uncharacterized membrane protein YqiK